MRLRRLPAPAPLHCDRGREREIDLALNQARTLNAADAAPNLAEVSVDAQLGKSARVLALSCSTSPARWLESER